LLKILRPVREANAEGSKWLALDQLPYFGELHPNTFTLACEQRHPKPEREKLPEGRPQKLGHNYPVCATTK
jgi:hypothetical protein